MGGNDGGFHAWRIEIFTFDEKAAKDQGSLTNLRLETNKNTQWNEIDRFLAYDDSKQSSNKSCHKNSLREKFQRQEDFNIYSNDSAWHDYWLSIRELGKISSNNITINYKHYSMVGLQLQLRGLV